MSHVLPEPAQTENHFKQSVLIICASDDDIPLAWKQRIVDLAPTAKMLIIADSRHAVPIERPAAFNAVLFEFLDEKQEYCFRRLPTGLVDDPLV